MPLRASNLRTMSQSEDDDGDGKEDRKSFYNELHPRLMEEFKRFRNSEDTHQRKIVSRALWWFMQQPEPVRIAAKKDLNRWIESGCPPLSEWVHAPPELLGKTKPAPAKAMPEKRQRGRKTG